MALTIGAHAKNNGAANSIATPGVTTTGGSGSVFVIGIAWYGTSAAPTSVTDSKGNTYTRVRNVAPFTTDTAGKTAIYYCAGGTGGATHTGSAAWADASGGNHIFFIELLGFTTPGLHVSAQGQADTATPFDSGSITTTIANAILIGYMASYTSGIETKTLGNSFSSDDSYDDGSTSFTGFMAHRIVSATGTYNTTFTSTGSGPPATAEAVSWIVAFADVPPAGPTITSQPSNAHVAVGATTTFAVTATASGGGSLSYQWKKNGTNVSGGSGGTTASYTTPALGVADDTASYTCDVTETGGTNPGTVTSSAATLRVGIILVAANTAVTSTAGATTISPSYSTLPTLQSGDEIVLIVAQKPSTANGGTVTTPTGYTLVNSLTGAGGYSTTLANNTGNTNLFVYRKTTAATGSETGTLSVTLGTSDVAWALFVRLRPPPGSVVSYASSTGSDTTSGNVSVTLAADPGVTAGDVALFAFNGSSALATYSAEAVTTTGVTYGSTTELAQPSTTAGNDVAGFVAYAIASSGTSSAAPVFTATTGGTTTNARGPGILVRVRAVAGSNTPMTVSVTQTQTLSSVRGVGMARSAVQVASTGWAPLAGYLQALSVTQAQTLSAARAAARVTLLAQTQSLTRTRGAARQLSSTETQTPSFVKGQGYLKNLSATIAQTLTLASARALVRTLSATVVQTPARVLTLGRVLSRTAVQTAAYLRALAFARNANQAQAPSAARGLGFARSLAQAQASSVAKGQGYLKTLSAVQSQASSLARAAASVLSVTASQTLARARAVARTLALNTSQTPSVSNQQSGAGNHPMTLTVSATQTTSLARALAQAWSTGQVQSMTHVRLLSKLPLTTTQTQTSSLTKGQGFFKTATATAVQIITRLRSAGVARSAVQVQAASRSAVLGLIRSTVAAQALAVTRAANRATSLVTSQTPALQQGRGYFKTLAAVVTQAPARAVSLGLQRAVTSVQAFVSARALSFALSTAQAQIPTRARAFARSLAAFVTQQPSEQHGKQNFMQLQAGVTQTATSALEQIAGGAMFVRVGRFETVFFLPPSDTVKFS